MKINIAASHRFHLLDLARELESLGHEVTFYSFVPTYRAMKFGIKKETCYSLFYLMLPFLFLLSVTNRADWTLRICNSALDKYLYFFMKPCDVFIGIGFVYKSSFVAAKNKFGAITINDWGSKHNEEQFEISLAFPEPVRQRTYFKKRILHAYEIADYIAIPAEHVEKTFIDRGILKEKLIRNPYGVDLSMFKPTKLTDDKPYDVIMVGTWCYDKGCDVLSTFFKNSELRLLHVGTIGDVCFPNRKNMTHINPVKQEELTKYYAKARIFVLPSRGEGLAMVQSQAIASGLPIVCSKDSGGRDLRNFLEEKKWIIEMEELTVEELSNCIDAALELAKAQSGFRSYIGKTEIDNLSWEAYGKRYEENLKKIVNFNRVNANIVDLSQTTNKDVFIAMLTFFGDFVYYEFYSFINFI